MKFFLENRQGRKVPQRGGVYWRYYWRSLARLAVLIDKVLSELE